MNINFNKMQNLAAVVVLSFFLGACSYHTDKGTDSLLKGSKFSQVMQGILQTKCVDCHSGPSASKGVDLSTYSLIMQTGSVKPSKPEISTLYDTVRSGMMPKGRARLEKAEVDLIYTWILEGAKEADIEGQSTDKPKPSFQYISKNIFQAKCVICHNNEKPRGKVNLSSYEALMASTGNKVKPINLVEVEKSTLYLELAEKKMPPTPKMLNEEEIDALRAWITVGAPEKTLNALPLPGPNEPNPPQPTYEWLSKNIFSRRCNSCHGIPYKIAAIDFTSYTTLLASVGKTKKPLVPNEPEQSAIYTEVELESMPPARKTVSEEETALVRQWIAEGAKNN